MTASNGTFWDLLERIRRSGDVHALRRNSLEAAQAIGFDAIYFLAPVVADPGIGRVLANLGFDPRWAERYRTEFYAVDPLPQIAMTRQSAFRWKQDVDRSELSDAQAAYLDRLPEFGMEEGYAVPCFGPFARCGFVGVGRPRSEEMFSPESRLKVEVSARVSFQRYVRLVRPFPDADPALSPRELEVLRWIGEGKSNSVIAEILEISPSSVDSYVKRVFAKLGVSDRTSASVRALALGLIVSGDYPREAR